MNVETLENIGLSSNESKVYMALLELGSSLAGKITERSKVNRRTVYDVLESLINKGLVSYIIEANRKVFEAADPTRILELIKEKEKEIQDVMPELIAKKMSSLKKQEAAIYRGRKGIRTIYDDILKHKEYRFFGSHGRFKEEMGPYFNLFQRNVLQKKIKAYALISERLRRNKEIAKHANVRYLKKDYDSPVSTLIYDKKVAIIIWSEEPIGLVAEGKEISTSFKNYFDVMWNIGKK
ncbi:MAG: helix-turn-helix domain-containing protein [Candidatus Woesearchaeota archaeon]